MLQYRAATESPKALGSSLAGHNYFSSDRISSVGAKNVSEQFGLFLGGTGIHPSMTAPSEAWPRPWMTIQVTDWQSKPWQVVVGTRRNVRALKAQTLTSPICPAVNCWGLWKGDCFLFLHTDSPSIKSDCNFHTGTSSQLINKGKIRNKMGFLLQGTVNCTVLSLLILVPPTDTVRANTSNITVFLGSNRHFFHQDTFSGKSHSHHSVLINCSKKPL